MWEKLDAELQKEADRNSPPPDSFTTRDIADRADVTYSVAQCLIGRLLREKRAEFIGRYGPRSEKRYRML